MSENTPTRKPGAILAAGFLPNDAMSALEEHYTIHHHYRADDPAALLQEVADDIVCMVGTSHASMPAELINALPKLQQISVYGTGTEKVDASAAKARSITITNTPDVMTSDVADLGMGLILATVRRMAEADNFVRQGRSGNESMPFSYSLGGKHLGIVGLGKIGSEIARRAEPFGLKICYHARHEKPDAPYPWYPDLLTMASVVDILLLAAPGGQDTFRMIDAQVLKALGPEGTLINIARGSLVDEKALVHALQEGTLGAAGLDVFEDLAKPSAGLFSMPNVVLSPHRGSATYESRGAMARLIVDNVEAFFAGRPALTPLPKT